MIFLIPILKYSFTMNQDSCSKQYEVFSKQPTRALFHRSYEIPYNQRNYQWDSDNIDQFIDDIDRLYNERISFLTFGSFYFLDEKYRKFTIWDGQQRLITNLLFLAACKKIIENIKENEDDCNLGAIDDCLFKKDYELNENEKLLKNDKKIRIPKIYSVYDNDNNIIQLLLNGKLDNIYDLYEQPNENINEQPTENINEQPNENINEDNDEIDDNYNNYYCKQCKKKYKSKYKNKMIEHIVKQHHDNDTIKTI